MTSLIEWINIHWRALIVLAVLDVIASLTFLRKPSFDELTVFDGTVDRIQYAANLHHELYYISLRGNDSVFVLTGSKDQYDVRQRLKVGDTVRIWGEDNQFFAAGPGYTIVQLVDGQDMLVSYEAERGASQLPSMRIGIGVLVYVYAVLGYSWLTKAGNSAGKKKSWPGVDAGP